MSYLLRIAHPNPWRQEPQLREGIWAEDDLGNHYYSMEEHQALSDQGAFRVYMGMSSGNYSAAYPFATYYDMGVSKHDPAATEITLHFDRYGEDVLWLTIPLEGGGLMARRPRLPPPAGSAGRPCAPSFCRSCWRRCCWCWTFPFSLPGALWPPPKSGTPPAPGRSLPGSAPSRRACPRYGTTSSATGTGSPGAVWRGTACVWRPGALTAACPDGEAPLAILASPTFGGTSPELVVVSSDPDIAAVELDYLVKSAIIDTVVYVHVEMARQEPLEDSCFYFSLEDAYSRLFL